MKQTNAANSAATRVDNYKAMLESVSSLDYANGHVVFLRSMLESLIKDEADKAIEAEKSHFQDRDDEIRAAVALMDKSALRSHVLVGCDIQNPPTRPFLHAEWAQVPVGDPVRRRGKNVIALIEGVNTESLDSDVNPNWILVEDGWISAIDLYVDYEYVSGGRLGVMIDPASLDAPKKPDSRAVPRYLPPGTYVQTAKMHLESSAWDKTSAAYLNRRWDAIGRVSELRGGTYMVQHTNDGGDTVVACYERAELKPAQ